VQRSKDELQAAVGMAGSRGSVTSDGLRALDTWERAARDRMSRIAGLAVIDASMRTDRQAMRDAIDPAFLGPEPGGS
jgi:hypothetical protein